VNAAPLQRHDKNKRCRLLIVDDDSDILSALNDAISIVCDIDIETTTNGNSAILLTNTFKPNILLIDIKLGNDNGIDISKKIKQVNPDISCIIMTAHREIEYTISALRSGVEDYLLKPINTYELITKIHALSKKITCNNDKPSQQEIIIKQSTGIFILLDQKGLIVEASSQAIRLFLAQGSNLKGTNLINSRSFSDRRINRNRLLTAIVAARNGVCDKFEISLDVENNRTIWFDFNVSPICDIDQGIEYILIEAHDITGHIETENRLITSAQRDYLTNLHNRASFNDHLSSSISSANRHHHSFCIMFIDIDNFKPINDTLGHKEGDNLLIKIADLLNRCSRNDDMAARIGGDEFILIFNSVTNKDTSYSIAKRILTDIHNLTYTENTKISASIGIAFYPEHANSQDELLTNADTAMYYSKNNGGNTFTLFEPDMHM